MTSTPEPGWYPDRPNATALRWWDGESWTDDFHDLVESTVQEPTPVSRRDLRQQVGGPKADDSNFPFDPQAGSVALLERHDPASEGENWHHESGAGNSKLSSLDLARLAGGYDARHTETIEQSPPERFAQWEVPHRSSQTLPGWILALSPIWLTAIGAVFYVFLPKVDQFDPRLAASLAGLVVLIGLVALDRSALRHRGYRPPSILLAVLPLVYLIARTARVGAKGLGMLLAYAIPNLAIVGVAAWVALTLVANPALSPFAVPETVTSQPVIALTPADRSAMLTDAGTEARLREELSGVWTVGDLECEPFASAQAGTTTTCVVELDGTPYNAGLQVSPDDPEAAFVLLGMIPVES